ncbi:MAG: ABC transporter ATP-binding protein [Clostridiaceae bacterium]|nr:ABC transporter ATP-binding protein [Clostridiaceae bacterium]
MNGISCFLHTNLFAIADDLLKFIATFSWMLWLNPKLTLSANAPTIIIILYTVYSSKLIGKSVQKSQEANAQMNSFADTLIAVFPILSLFDANLLMQEKYNAVLEQWKNACISEESRRAKLMSLSALLSCIPLLLLFYYCFF